jgi:uncharacterized membrane protein
MKTTNKELMAAAREQLRGKWGMAAGAMALIAFVKITSQIIPIVSLFVPLLIAGPIALGMAIFMLSIARGKKTKVSQVFSGFDRFGTALGTYLLAGAFIILWSLLLIVPGIIAAFSYSQIWFILADNPKIGPKEAIIRSKAMMMGNKWNLFYLGLRFLGWSLLCILTIGIGFLWLTPYMSVSFANFYEEIKGGKKHVEKETAETATDAE